MKTRHILPDQKAVGNSSEVRSSASPAFRRLAAFVVLLLATTASPAKDQPRSIVVDALSDTGRIKSLLGTNGTPVPLGWVRARVLSSGEDNRSRPSEYFRPIGVDISKGYQAMGIDLVRTHDWIGQVGDIDSVPNSKFRVTLTDGSSLSNAEAAKLAKENNIFPNPEADPSDPRSYNFAPTDRVIKSVVDIGAQTFFRVGRGLGAEASPPKDLKKYARIVGQIVRHYNLGWNNGFTKAIRYWEIWNEPDLSFWKGTAAEYFALYLEVATAIKEADPTAQVGGPALAHQLSPSAYRDEFLRFVKDNRLPLDFYSWHFYSGTRNGDRNGDPLTFSQIGRRVREQLDAAGFHSTKIALTEWNFWDQIAKLDETNRAAFIACSLIYMQDSPIDLAMGYRFDANVKRDGVTLDKLGQALRFLSHFKDAPVRLSASGGDQDGMAVLAGASASRDTFCLLVSNYQVFRPTNPSGASEWNEADAKKDWAIGRGEIVYKDNQSYRAKLQGLPAGRTWVMERYRIGNGVDGDLVETRTFSDSNIELSTVLLPPGIDLIVLRSKKP